MFHSLSSLSFLFLSFASFLFLGRQQISRYGGGERKRERKLLLFLKEEAGQLDLVSILSSLSLLCKRRSQMKIMNPREDKCPPGKSKDNHYMTIILRYFLLIHSLEINWDSSNQIPLLCYIFFLFYLIIDQLGLRVSTHGTLSKDIIFNHVIRFEPLRVNIYIL